MTLAILNQAMVRGQGLILSNSNSTREWQAALEQQPDLPSSVKEPLSGAAVILSLHALILSKDRRQQFWDRIDQHGFPVAA